MKNKVYLNLKESPYIVKKFGFVFVFSSMLYKQKFEKGYSEYILEETRKLNIKYKVSSLFEKYFLIAYYKKIEKRGFLIYEEKTRKLITENIIISENILYY